MELHHDTQAAVFPPEPEQQRGLELLLFLHCGDLTGQPLPEDGLYLRLRCRGKGHALHPVVGNAAAERYKEGQLLLQRLDQLFKAPNLTEAGHVVYIIFLFDPQRLVRAEAGQYFYTKAYAFSDLFVPFQRIRRVVGGAEGFHVGTDDQFPRGQCFKLLIAELPHLFGGVAVEEALIAEVIAQFQVAPVVERVPDGEAEGLRPLLELLAVRSIAGDELFVHAGPAHQPPLVVVTTQPDLRDVCKLPVLVDLPWIQMAVIVDDGKVCRNIVVEMPRRFGGQQKIPVHEWSHASKRSLSIQSPSAGFGM